MEAYKFRAHSSAPHLSTAPRGGAGRAGCSIEGAPHPAGKKTGGPVSDTEERAGPRSAATLGLAPEFFCRTPRVRQSDPTVGHRLCARDDGRRPLTGPVCGSSSRAPRFFPHVCRSRTRHVDRWAAMVGWSGPGGPAVPPWASIATTACAAGTFHRLHNPFWGWGAREGRPLAGPATPPRRAAANLKPTRHGRACCRRPPPHGGQPWPAPSTLARQCSPSGRLAAAATP